jgi:hypothetical protein
MKFQTIHHFDQSLRSYPDCEFEQLFIPPPQGNIEERFSIYATGYGARTRDAMEETYEVLSRLMSEEQWLDCGARYTNAFPSRSYNLADVGIFLPKFLKDESYAPEWVDLAQLELLVWKSFHAPRHMPLGLEEISKLAEDSRFEFAPSCFLFSTAHGVISMWNRREINSTEKKSEFGIIYRQDFIVRLRAISSGEFELLSNLQRGCVFGDALEASGEFSEVQKLAEWMNAWREDEIFSSHRRDS